MTHAKREMVEDNRSDLERWLTEIVSASNIKALLGRELVTVDELVTRLHRHSDRRVSSKAVNGALSKLGVDRIGKQALRSDGIRPRVYALANKSHYEAMSSTQLGSVLDQNPFKY